MSDQNQRIYDQQDLRKYYAQVVHMADDDLDLYEYRLYGHYKRVCGQGGGVCDETEKTTWTHCGMSRTGFRAARQGLVDKGYIHIVAEGSPNLPGVKGTPTVIACTDLWANNFVRYAQPDQIARMEGLLKKGNGISENPSPSFGGDKGSEEDRNGISENPKKKEEFEEERRLTGAGAAGEPISYGVSAVEQPSTDEPHEIRLNMNRKHVRAISLARGTDLLQHPLVQLFSEKTGVMILTGEMVKALTAPIKIRERNGGITTYQGGLIHYWDSVLGFEEFAKCRLAEFAAMTTAVMPIDMLKNLRNISKDQGRMKGFQVWRSEHPEVCDVISKAETPQITFGYSNSSEPRPIYN